MATTDPRALIAQTPMRTRQYIAVALCVLLNALDGFDVLSISFASPGIAGEWGIDRGALGIVLSMELIGMSIGSMLLGVAADRIGRRPTILLGLIIMASGMGLAVGAGNIVSLSAFRLFTGIGIGGMLACTNAMVAEWSNDRNRALTVAIMVAGYPLGAVIGGAIASSLLATGNWRDVFIFGASVTAILLPLTWFLLPESISYLSQHPSAANLARVNHILGRLGHAPVDTLPGPAADAPRAAMRDLFAPGRIAITLLITLAYFAHISTFYFIPKWVPKIVVDMGFTASSAGGVLVWTNVGGLAGSILCGIIATRLSQRMVVGGALLASVVAIILFGRTQADLTALSLMCAIAGFCTNGAVVGLYALAASAFPTALRAAGTGFVIGIGRGGAALSPIIAGFLFTSGVSLSGVATMMAMGSLIAAVAIFALGRRVRA